MKRVWLVDDDDFMHLLIYKKLKLIPQIKGISHFRSFNECINSKIVFKPDAIIVDLDLGDVDGFSLIESLKLKVNDVKFIVFSSNIDEFVEKRATELGVENIIAKDPKNIGNIAELLKTILS